jgi:NADPH-dependent 2,4-dienoyl-CoA reductase/sulfur reductase-like enzyme/rhodanese-related sulfurtransferase
MTHQKRIIVIGGATCGPKAASRARRCDPDATITLIEQGKRIANVRCALPYYISGVTNDTNDLVAMQLDLYMDVANVDVLINSEVVAIDRNKHEVTIRNVRSDRMSTVEYDKLVLATGTVPAGQDLPHSQLEGIVAVTGNEDADTIKKMATGDTKKAAIIGAGPEGIVLAEALTSLGLDITLVEALNWPLPAHFDFEMASHIEKHMLDNGVRFLAGQRVTGFEGDSNGHVCKVLTEHGEIKADLVLLTAGSQPNVKLARDAGLAIGAEGGISVNEYLQTSDTNIYAGGDCVENIHRITAQPVLTPECGISYKHGRIIGTNVTGGSETFPGVLGTTMVKTFDYNAGRTGLTEQQARDAGFDVITSITSANEHAPFYPNSKEILAKLVADKSTNKILGGQVIGPGDAAKRIDVLATAIMLGATIHDIANLDLAGAPPYNIASDVLQDAAIVLINKQSGHARGITTRQVKEKLDSGSDFIFLDVRSPEEWEACGIEATQIKQIELRELWAKLDELPEDANIVAFCKRGLRGYQAQRILEDAGYKNVTFMDGSIAAWPYDLTGTKPF